MADYDSSLPIRTEEAGDVDIFVSDATTPTQKLKVNADGSIDTNTSLPTGTKVEITDGTDDLEINADGSVNAIVTASDLDIRDLVAVTDSVAAHLFDEAGAAFTSLNPLPVSFAADGDGDEICDYNTSAAVAKDASVNHDYTVTAAKTFLGEEAWISGSGKLKVELLINGATVFVGFNSTSSPNVRIPMEKICKANATEVIRMTITNRDNQLQDVYSTLLGVEV